MSGGPQGWALLELAVQNPNGVGVDDLIARLEQALLQRDRLIRERDVLMCDSIRAEKQRRAVAS